MGDGGNIARSWVLNMPELTKYCDNGESRMERAPPDESEAIWGKFNLLNLEGVVKVDWHVPKSEGAEWNRNREISPGGDEKQGKGKFNIVMIATMESSHLRPQASVLVSGKVMENGHSEDGN